MPRIENTNAGESAFAPKSKNGKKNIETPKEVENMVENTEAINEVAALTNNSPVSIADLYSEMEKEIVVKGSPQNTGVTARIRELVEQIFSSTGKDKLLLSAVVKIVETQENRKKMYNLVRSIAMSKSEHAKYALLTEDGRTYIVRK